MQRATSLLRMLEQVMQTPKEMAHFSKEKVFLPSMEQYVPRSVDWRKVFTDSPRQTEGDCYAANVYGVLQNFGGLIEKQLEMPYEDLLYKDFRNTPEGGKMAVALEHGMLNGIYTPYVEGDEDPFHFLGKRVPISGYIRTLPCSEECFIRALAQQPLLSDIHAGDAFMAYRGGIFTGEKSKISGPLPLNHCVTAVAYDDEFITLQNSWAKDWGEDGCMRIPRGVSRGVNEVYTSCLFPYMLNHMTEFNERLIQMKMHVSRRELPNYHPRDMMSMFLDPSYPIDMKLKKVDELTKYWKHFAGNQE